MNPQHPFWDFVASMQQPGAENPFANQQGSQPNRGNNDPFGFMNAWGGPWGPMPHRGRPGPPPHDRHQQPPPPPFQGAPDDRSAPPPPPEGEPVSPPSRSPTPPTPPESVPGDHEHPHWGPPPHYPFPGEHRGPPPHHEHRGRHDRHASPGPSHPRGPHGRSPGPHGRHHSPGPHGRHHSPGPHGRPHSPGRRGPHRGPRGHSPGPRGGHGGRGRGGCGPRGGHGWQHNRPPFDPQNFNFDINNLPAFLSSLLGPEGVNKGLNAEKRNNGDGTFQPAIDVFATSEAYIVHVSLPGAKKSDLDVSWNASSGSLHLSGVVQRPREVDEGMLSCMTADERQIGLFERDVKLGDDKVDVEGITAKLEDGVLRVEVPKLGDEWTEVKKVDID